MKNIRPKETDMHSHQILEVENVELKHFVNETASIKWCLANILASDTHGKETD